MSSHIEKVFQLSEQLKNLKNKGIKPRIYHGSTNTTRSFEHGKENYLDISGFNEILEINVEEKYVVCEPNVPMDKLVEETLKHGLIPPVVMEFPGITVGGGISGGAGESSCFRYGLFNNTVLEIELMLANGDRIVTSKIENQDLFWGVAATLGTLGILTKIKLSLIESKPYVKMSYVKVNSFLEMQSELKRYSEKGQVDYIDGLMFDKNFGAIILGTLSDNPQDQTNMVTFSQPWDEWFYLRVKNKLINLKEYVEYTPIKEYFFRYDRGAFWMGEYSFKLSKIIPSNRFFKLIFNPWLSTRKLYKSLHSADLSRNYFIQDLCLPWQKTVEFCEFVDDQLGIYPLWFLPIKVSKEVDKFSPNNLDADFIINVGVWGGFRNNNIDPYLKNRELEKYLTSLGGRKIFYAHSYFPKEEFWQIYPKNWYDALRQKYGAENVFPNVWEKLFVKSLKKPKIIKGFFKFISSKKDLKI